MPPATPHHRRCRTERAFRAEWGAYPGRMPLLEIERLASTAHILAGTVNFPGPDPLRLARRAGLRLRHGSPLGCCGAQLLPGGVIVARANATGVDVTHELSHHLCNPFDHDHRDVWTLTLCIAFPREHLRLVRLEGWTARTLRRWQPHIESWALRERAWMARELAKALAG